MMILLMMVLLMIIKMIWLLSSHIASNQKSETVEDALFIRESLSKKTVDHIVREANSQWQWGQIRI